MDKVKVTIHVVAAGGDELKYDPNRDGKTKSTEEKINVIKVSDGYSVVYDDDTFECLSLSKLVSSLIQVFGTNVPDTIFDFGIQYHYEGTTDTYFDFDTAKKVLELDKMMRQIAESGKVPIFAYTRSDGLDDVLNDYRDAVAENAMYDILDEDETDDGDEEEDDQDDLLSLLTGGKPEKKTSKNKKDYYGRSRVWKNSKQPKKQINRHGVLIASDKEDLKRDEKIIKEFLKDFMPGDASWKKEFRNDVLQRWMSMYAISRKMLKQLEKQHRKARHKKTINGDRILNLTDRLFSVPVDRWSDPNK